MKLTKSFIYKYLGPCILMVLLFVILALLALIEREIMGSSLKYIIGGSIVVIIGLFAWLILQVLKDFYFQQEIRERLENSEEKYKSLMETSTDGTLLVLNGEILSANLVFLAMSGYTQKDLLKMKTEDLILDKKGTNRVLREFREETGDIGRTITTEAKLNCKRGDLREVILAVSKIRMMEKDGVIIVVKDISRRERIEKESMNLMNELQSSILLMNLPVTSFVHEHITCDMDMSVHEAAQLMKRKERDVVIIVNNSDNPVGILTDTDLRNRVVAAEHNYKSPVYEIMSSPIFRIPEQALLYEAIIQIQEKDISHMVVEDKKGKITGVFSDQDLLDVQRNSISYLIREVEAADSIETLKSIHNKIPVLVKILMESGARIRNITYMISTVTDAITHRLIEFAIEEMGEPPARFAFMAVGSEGRREQTLVTDQDNAIVFEDVPNDRLNEVSKYFLYFGKKINLWLDRIGYQYCQGDVMAGNPQWCQPLSRWKKYFSEWVNSKSEEGLLGVAVFFDFRIVYGMDQYGEELRKHINGIIENKSEFFRLLSKETAGYKIPQELPASFNVKNAIAPLVDFIRVYSIQDKVAETNTLLRLEKLMRLHSIDEPDYHEIDNLYNLMMEIRFRSHVSAILENKAPDNMVLQPELTAIEQSMITQVFSEISQYQVKIVDDFS